MTLITQGIHDGTISWIKWEQVVPQSPRDSPNNTIWVTQVHFQDSETLQINGLYNFRIGAHYQIRLISGNMVSGMIVGPKAKPKE